MPKIDTRAFTLLGEMVRPPPPPEAHDPNDSWSPDLNPTQQKAWDCNARFLLLWGAKGGAKTFLAVNKLVKHCYENQNGLALILVRVQNMAKKGGAWDKLLTEIIPKWKAGLGIQFSEVKTDQQHYQYIWIENRYGGWSMIAVMSSPHAHQLRDRVRGMEPSMVFVDELTSCASNEYFQSVAAQLGRRPFVEGVQQYIAACNPEGPSHWVYQQFFVTPFNEETGEWDADFEQIHFPREENRHRMQAGYFEGLSKIYKGDKVESARMEDGEWVDRPSGEALFAEIYHVVIHVRPITDEGHPHPKQRLRPHPGHPIIIGLDPGSVFNAFIFQQYLRVDDRMKWVIFDELVSIRKRISYPDFIPMVMRRVLWWREEVGVSPGELPQVWISDNSAFNQYRAAQGSYDVLEIEKIYEMNRTKYKLEALKVKQCPKFNGSVVARVQIGQRLLGEENVIVSAGCPHVNRMFFNLQGKKPKPGEPLDPEALLTPQRSDFVHTWDATSYPWLMASLNPTALVPINTGTQTLISAAA
jgi:hypothetical protein